MKRFSQTLFTFILLSSMLLSCSSSKVEKEAFTIIKTDNIGKTLEINMVEVDSMKLIKSGHDANSTLLGKDLYATLSTCLQTAVYDAQWNESGIMRKMTVPDYTIVVSYIDKPREANDWLQIWRKLNKIRFKNIWYSLPANEGKELYKHLEK